MKRFLLSIFSLFAVVAVAYSADRAHTLKIYNWADYIDVSVLDEFKVWYKEQTGEEVEIVYQLFDINEIMLAKIEKGKEDFDVVCPSEYIIERMLRNDMLLPINKEFGKHRDIYIVRPIVDFERVRPVGRIGNSDNGKKGEYG